MNELLNKALNQLTEEEKNQLSDKQKKDLKTLIGSKPSVPFSRATPYDCVRPNGLELKIDYVTLNAPPTIHIPDDFAAPAASAHLCESLARIEMVWVLNNMKACRMLIDAILIEVLKSEFNDTLYGFCDVKNDWEGTGFGYTGNVDYMFGSSKIKSVGTMESSLLVVLAKKEWPDDAVAQVLCEAGCLLKKKMAAGKNTPVFAVLTNGLLFRFFAIDTNSVVYASETELLKIGKDVTYNSSTSLSEILRWFTWFMTATKSVSPRASSEDLTAEMIDDSLTRLRSCFGPKNPLKNPISSKKLKIQ